MKSFVRFIAFLLVLLFVLGIAALVLIPTLQS